MYVIHILHTKERDYMNSISLRLNKEDAELVKNYVAVNNLNLSAFIRNLLLDKIEEDFKLDEARILKAYNRSKKENGYTLNEACKELGI